MMIDIISLDAMAAEDRYQLILKGYFLFNYDGSKAYKHYNRAFFVDSRAIVEQLGSSLLFRIGGYGWYAVKPHKTD